ncbi:hypothetical protein HWV62_39710 [Athelia sp. TMB]|nr:hypothetical protein HWV62_39710 [Athelia sp. TMB]
MERNTHVNIQGGDYLTPQYLTEKTAPFFRGREMLDRADFAIYMHPAIASLPPISSSPLSYNPETRYPTNERMFLSRLYLQLGIMLDYLTGEHSPSLSEGLQTSLASDKLDLATRTHPYAASEYAAFDNVNHRIKALIPERVLPAFSQFSVTSSWPPTYLVHGANDTAVLAHESYYLHHLLANAGVDAKLQIIEGKEHSFDYEPDAEELHGKEVFDEVARWLEHQLRK